MTMNGTASSSLGTSPVMVYIGPDINGSYMGNSTPDSNGNTTELYWESDWDEKRRRYESYIIYQVSYNVALYYLWVVLAFGVPGNLASIFTIMSMPTVSSSKAHVAILSLTDTVAIVMKITYWEVSGNALKLTGPGCAMIMFVQQFSTDYANWVVVAMTAERFLAVWFPLRVGRMYTRRKALIVLGCFAVMVASVFVVFFWAWTEQHEVGYGYWCSLRTEYEAFIYDTFYWITAVFSLILPCCFILIGNTLIILNIRRARKAQRHLTNSFDQGGRTARDQRQITVMLVVVSVVFLLLNMPNAIFYIVKPTWKKSIERFSYEDAQYYFTARLIHVLSDSNHAVNFYLYFLSMSTFRRRFIDAIRCRTRNKRRPANSSVYRTSQTYMHSANQYGDSRIDGNGTSSSNSAYSAYKRSSSNNMDNHHHHHQHHPLRTLSTSNNRATAEAAHNSKGTNGIDTANSDV